MSSVAYKWGHYYFINDMAASLLSGLSCAWYDRLDTNARQSTYVALIPKVMICRILLKFNYPYVFFHSTIRWFKGRFLQSLSLFVTAFIWNLCAHVSLHYKHVNIPVYTRGYFTTQWHTTHILFDTLPIYKGHTTHIIVYHLAYIQY